ncbi:MAG: rod shape-determining protein [Alphaproteobacteria bacterium]|nr:rod shape-determining protein [Alphaproteobacteria bacterium]
MARLIAIDLGAWAVKVSVFQGSAEAENLEGEYLRRVPQDGTERPTMADRLATLDLMLRDHPEWSAEAHLTAVTWPSERASVHRVMLPFATDDQIGQTLPFAVEAEVPFELDDMVLGWRKGDDVGEIHVTLVRHDDLERFIDGLAERDMDPRRVYTDGDVLAAYGRFGDSVTAVVDVGHEHTTIVVCRGGKALAYRSASVAGRWFTRVIQEALGCSWVEAEALKHGASDDVSLSAADDEDTAPLPEGDDEPSVTAEATDPAFGTLPGKAKLALEGAIGLLLAEVRATLVTFEDELGVEIDEVVLCGGGANVPDLDTFLHQDLGVLVRRADDPTGGPVRAAFAVSRALAHHVTGESEGPVDLRIDDLAYHGGMDTPRAILTYGGATLAFFLLAVVALSSWQYYDLSQQRAAVDTRIATTVTAVAPDLPAGLDGSGYVSALADLVYDAQQEAEFLGDVGAAPPTVDMLYTLSRAFPPHPDVIVDLNELEINPASIRIQGITENFAEVDQIGQSLEDAGVFGGVVATPKDRDSKGRLNFTVDIDREASGDEVGDTDEPTGEEG